MIYAHPRWIERVGIYELYTFSLKHGLVIVQTANRKWLKLVEKK